MRDGHCAWWPEHIDRRWTAVVSYDPQWCYLATQRIPLHQPTLVANPWLFKNRGLFINMPEATTQEGATIHLPLDHPCLGSNDFEYIFQASDKRYYLMKLLR